MSANLIMMSAKFFHRPNMCANSKISLTISNPFFWTNLVKGNISMFAIDCFLIALTRVASTFSSVPCIHIWKENEIVAVAVMMSSARRPFSDAKIQFI